MSLKQLESTKREVGGYDFYITPFPAFDAVRISADLLSVLAPLAGAIVPLAKAVGDDGDKENKENENENILDTDVSAIAEALSNCVIDGDQIVKLMKKLLLGGNIVVNMVGDDGEDNPQKLTLDIANEIFCGDTQDMFVLCVYVINLNYKGFFKRLAGQFGNLTPAAVKQRKIL